MAYLKGDIGTLILLGNINDVSKDLFQEILIFLPKNQRKTCNWLENGHKNGTYHLILTKINRNSKLFSQRNNQNLSILTSYVIMSQLVVLFFRSTWAYFWMKN